MAPSYVRREACGIVAESITGRGNSPTEELDPGVNVEDSHVLDGK